MRTSKWLIAAGLAAAAAFASGCKTSGDGLTKDGDPVPTPPPFMPYPGVVEIYRNNDMTQIAGYCSPVDASTYSWWLLNGNETPPVMPQPMMVYVTWKRVSDENMDGKTLCDTYGPRLVAPKLWYVNRGDPSDCVPVEMKK